MKKIALKREVIFRDDPFNPILKTHKLHGKFSYFWSFSITQKHRVMFELRENETVVFVDIGDHSIYE